jgi:predicted enzyme related to lactoylglutathione lyase
MPRPVHFEFSADQPERAARFYEHVFGWEVRKWEYPGAPDYWLIKTGEDGEPGIDGGMARRGEGPDHTTNTIAVPSLDEAIEAVTKYGGHVVTKKMGIPNVGWLAYATDTEGNSFGMLEADESAVP